MSRRGGHSGAGVASSVNDPVRLQPGTLVKDGRYEILKLHHSTRQTPFPWAHATYVAFDTMESRGRCIRFIGRAASGSEDWLRNGSAGAVLVSLQVLDTDPSRDLLLLPRGGFLHDGLYPAEIYELVGPNLFHLRQYGGPDDYCYPPAWIRKVAREGLQSLRVLHAHNIVHGAVGPMALVVVYKQLERASRDEVEKFYTSERRETGSRPFSVNETGTAAYGEPMDLRCRFKLQWPKTLFDPSEGGARATPQAASQCVGLECPPPELLLQLEVGLATDMWYFGILLANLLAAAPESSSLIGERGRDPLSRLLDAQRLLGPLPPAMRALLPPDRPRGFDGPYAAPGPSVAAATRACRERMARDATGEKAVAERAFRDAADGSGLDGALALVRGLLVWDPAERLSVEQALAYDFVRDEGV